MRPERARRRRDSFVTPPPPLRSEVPADKKIAVLKIVRTITGLGLKVWDRRLFRLQRRFHRFCTTQEAKGMVESAPVTIKEGAPKDEAADIQKQIEEGGAKVELK